MTFTGNDFAQAQMAAGLAIAWHKQQPTSDFNDREISKLTALIAKLDRLLNEFGPLLAIDDGETEFDVRLLQEMTPTD